MTTVERRPWLDAVADYLAAETGLPVGRNSAPPGDPKHYLTVWSIPGGGFSGPPLADPYADAAVVFQVDSVGELDAQAEGTADLVRAAMLDRAQRSLVPPAGWGVMQVRPDGGPPGVDSAAGLSVAAERYVFDVTPIGAAA